MQLLEIKVDKQSVYVPNCYPTEIKNNKIRYFLRGKGWITKGFRVVQGVELPDDTWSKEVTWLDIAKMWDQWGIEVANAYADRKTAGIISRQTAAGYGTIYRKIKEAITDQEFDPRFFELMRCDYKLSCFGIFSLDIIGLDKKLSQLDSEYSSENAKYKGENCSMSDYVEQKYGKLYSEVVRLALSV